MPIPAIAGAAIGAGSSVAGGFLNALSGTVNTGLQLRHNKKLYEQQYRDNIDFWRMQNAYNTPQAQMQRFQDAGLNPALIYGQGNAGNASQITTPDQNPVEFRDPRVGDAFAAAGSSLADFFDFEIKQAQVDNLRAQNTVIQQDALLRGAQIMSTLTRNEKDKFDLGFKSEFRNISADLMREQLRQMRTTTDVKLNEDVRRAALTAKTLEAAAQNLINSKASYKSILLSQGKTAAETERTKAETARSRQSLQNMIQDGTLKELDIQLRRKGLNPSDPTWTRVTSTILDDISRTGSISESILNYLFN